MMSTLFQTQLVVICQSKKMSLRLPGRRKRQDEGYMIVYHVSKTLRHIV